MKWILLLTIAVAGCAATTPASHFGAGVTVVDKEGRCFACYADADCERIDMEFCGQEPQLAEQPPEELLDPEPEPEEASCYSCTLDIKQRGVMQCRLEVCLLKGKQKVQTPYLLTIGKEAIVVLGMPKVAADQ